MPTVLRVDGFRVIILLPPREHGPAHVHVVKEDGDCVVYLGSAKTPPSTDRCEGMSRADQRRAERIVVANTLFLREKWREIHG